MGSRMTKGREADPLAFSVERDDGTRGVPEDGLVPIFRQEPSAEWRLIGTGFCINGCGLIATAKHVLMDVIKDGRQIAGIFALHILPDGFYLMRPILRCAVHNQADVGVAVMAPATHNESGETLRNKSFRLTERQLAVGEPVHTCAFPNTRVKHGPTQKLTIQADFYSGVVCEYFPKGRDAVMLPAPCYQTSITIHQGASGGPMFTADGRVCGINSTGIEGHEDISFVSGIDDLLSIILNNVNTIDDPEIRDRPIRELVSIDKV